MPQTGMTNGHAHMYREGDEFTGPFEDHGHSLPEKGLETGPAINLATRQPEPNGHIHDLPDRSAREVPRRI